MKIEFRNLFSNFFGNKPASIPGASLLKMINTLVSHFYNFDGNIYDNDTVRSCIHTIAAHCAKLEPKHKLKDVNVEQSSIQRILSLRPNRYMSSYDFIYKVVSLLYTSNNVFIYVRYENKKLEGLYPIDYSSVQLLEYENEVYAQFFFMTGRQVTIPLTELMHIRRHFCKNDLFGEDAVKPLTAIMNVAVTIIQGIVNAIKSSAILRGILKFNSKLAPEDLKKQKDDFVNDFLNIANNNGLAATDAKFDYVPLESKPIIADDKQMAFVRENILRYYNLSDKIISSNYTEEEFNAFYSSVIEPIAIQLSQEFTYKLFTPTELGFGNEVEFSTDRITFANLKTKVLMVKNLLPLGILNINQGKSIFNLPSIGDKGEKHIISLNYVDLDKANQYQLGEDDNNDFEDNKETD